MAYSAPLTNTRPNLAEYDGTTAEKDTDLLNIYDSSASDNKKLSLTTLESILNVSGGGGSGTALPTCTEGQRLGYVSNVWSCVNALTFADFFPNTSAGLYEISVNSSGVFSLILANAQSGGLSQSEVNALIDAKVPLLPTDNGTYNLSIAQGVASWIVHSDSGGGDSVEFATGEEVGAGTVTDKAITPNALSQGIGLGNLLTAFQNIVEELLETTRPSGRTAIDRSWLGNAPSDGGGGGSNFFSQSTETTTRARTRASITDIDEDDGSVTISPSASTVTIVTDTFRSQISGTSTRITITDFTPVKLIIYPSDGGSSIERDLSSEGSNRYETDTRNSSRLYVGDQISLEDSDGTNYNFADSDGSGSVTTVTPVSRKVYDFTGSNVILPTARLPLTFFDLEESSIFDFLTGTNGQSSVRISKQNIKSFLGVTSLENKTHGITIQGITSWTTSSDDVDVALLSGSSTPTEASLRPINFNNSPYTQSSSGTFGVAISIPPSLSKSDYRLRVVDGSDTSYLNLADSETVSLGGSSESFILTAGSSSGFIGYGRSDNFGSVGVGGIFYLHYRPNPREIEIYFDTPPSPVPSTINLYIDNVLYTLNKGQFIDNLYELSVPSSPFVSGQSYNMRIEVPSNVSLSLTETKELAYFDHDSYKRRQYGAGTTFTLEKVNHKTIVDGESITDVEARVTTLEAKRDSFTAVEDGSARGDLTDTDVKVGTIVREYGTTNKDAHFEVTSVTGGVSFRPYLVGHPKNVANATEIVHEGDFAWNGDKLYFARSTQTGVTASTDFTTSDWIPLHDDDTELTTRVSNLEAEVSEFHRLGSYIDSIKGFFDGYSEVHTATTRIDIPQGYSNLFDYRSSSSSYLSTGITFDDTQDAIVLPNNSLVRVVSAEWTSLDNHETIAFRDSAGNDVPFVRLEGGVLQYNSSGSRTGITWVNAEIPPSGTQVTPNIGDTLILQVRPSGSRVQVVPVIKLTQGTTSTSDDVIQELDDFFITNADLDLTRWEFRGTTNYKGFDPNVSLRHEQLSDLLSDSHIDQMWAFGKARLVETSTTVAQITDKTNFKNGIEIEGTDLEDYINSLIGDGSGGGGSGVTLTEVNSAIDSRVESWALTANSSTQIPSGKLPTYVDDVSLSGSTLTISRQGGDDRSLTLPTSSGGTVTITKSQIITALGFGGYLHLGVANIEGGDSGLVAGTTTHTATAANANLRMERDLRFDVRSTNVMPTGGSYDSSTGNIVLPAGHWIVCASVVVRNHGTVSNQNVRVIVTLGLKYGTNIRHEQSNYIRWADESTQAGSAVRDDFSQGKVSIAGSIISDGTTALNINLVTALQGSVNTTEQITILSAHVHAYQQVVP